MKDSMNRDLVRRWLRGWEAVAQFEIEETRRLSVEDRLKQMAALMRMTRQCHMRPTYRADEIEHVRRRWARLRAANGHESP